MVAAIVPRVHELRVLNTICSATSRRQQAAEELAREADVMVVVGGKNSGNTTRLAEVCRRHCPRTHHIESPEELRAQWFCGARRVGITAGASTPSDQIQAVRDGLERLVPRGSHDGTPAAFDGAAPQVGAYEPGATQARSLASGRERWRGALISEVTPGGPAQLAGLEAGMRITHVNGEELRDVIDWDWEADGFAVQVDGIAYEGTPEEFEFTCDIERDLGQEWGLAFDGVVFDGMRLCRNRCTFCFMRMLPDSMRSL